MRAIEGDVIGTTDGRYGTVRCEKGGTLLVESLPILNLETLTSEDGPGSEFFEVTQAEVASIR